jgi:general secretion pathway protein L
LATFIGDVAAWWTQQMLDLIPEEIRARAVTWSDAVVVEWHPPGHALVTQRRNRRERQIGKFSLEGGLQAARRLLVGPRRENIVLRLPSDLLLERQIVLPLAVERELSQVVAYEMDRLTPFAPEEVFWAASVESRNKSAGRLTVRLSVVTKAAVRPVLHALDAIGVRPAAIEIPLGEMPVRRISLRKAAWRAKRRRRLALGTVASVCGVLALAAVVGPFVAQSIALGAVQQQIDTLQPRVDEIQALRRRLAATAADTDAVAAERARVGNVLQGLAALTSILPDDTYLTALRLRQRKLTLDGQSQAAAKLIAALASDPLIRNPAFVAPVTRAEASKGDLFSIRAELAP